MSNINKFGGMSYYYDVGEDEGSSANALHLSSTDADVYDASGKRIGSLAEPQEPNDAVSMSHLNKRLFNLDKDAQQYVEKFFLKKSVYVMNIADMESKLSALRKSMNDCQDKISALQQKVGSTGKKTAFLEQITGECKQKINMLEPMTAKILVLERTVRSLDSWVKRGAS